MGKRGIASKREDIAREHQSAPNGSTPEVVKVESLRSSESLPGCSSPQQEAVREELNAMITTMLPDLMSIVRRLSGNFGASPESLMNELMVTRVLKRAHFPRERRPFIGWVIANLRRVSIDRVRSETSRKRREKSAAHHEATERVSLGSMLEPALKSLDRVDPEGGMMVRMRYFAGMKVEDIALTCGVDRKTVGRKLKQSLAYLASKLSHE